MNAAATPLGQEKPDERAQNLRDQRNTAYFFSVFILLGLLFVWTQMGWDKRAATPLLWALACLTSGAAVGFLFGIPKILQGNGLGGSGLGGAPTPPGAPIPSTSAPTAVLPAAVLPTAAASSANGLAAAYQQRVNTNLEEISDWLTKIIVGLGLINLAKLPTALRGIASTLAADADAPRQNAFALALIVYFTVLGFLYGYLFTRLFLQTAFAHADRSAMNVATALTQAVSRATQQAFADNPEAGKELSVGQIQAAQQVAQIAQQGDISLVRQKVWELAQEYEQTRSSQPPGDARTRQLEIVVTKMRTLAIAALPLLPELTSSLTPGQRLAAVAILQVKPNGSYVDWLAARLAAEKPFIGFQASVALLTAVRTLDVSFKPQLLNALATAKAGLRQNAVSQGSLSQSPVGQANLGPARVAVVDGVPGNALPANAPPDQVGSVPSSPDTAGPDTAGPGTAGQGVTRTDRYRLLEQAEKELQPDLAVGQHL